MKFSLINRYYLYTTTITGKSSSNNVLYIIIRANDTLNRRHLSCSNVTKPIFGPDNIILKLWRWCGSVRNSIINQRISMCATKYKTDKHKLPLVSAVTQIFFYEWGVQLRLVCEVTSSLVGVSRFLNLLFYWCTIANLIHFTVCQIPPTTDVLQSFSNRRNSKLL